MSVSKAGTLLCCATYQSGKRKGQGCTEFASFLSHGKYVCGIHSDKQIREPLPKQTHEELEQIEKDHNETIKKESERRQKAGLPGEIQMYRINKYRTTPHIPGVLDIYPNYFHQSIKTGFGCASLSPMSTRIIQHGQPGLPECKILENFHQGSKRFDWETDEDFIVHRLFMYQCGTPRRHKTKDIFTSSRKRKAGPFLRSGETATEEKTVASKCQYFVWRDKDGTEYALDRPACRQFYCNFYEDSVRSLPDFRTLQEFLSKGYRLRLCGHDAIPFERSIDQHYLCEDEVFGHERVLYTMLTCPDPQQYPWRKYRTFVLPNRSDPPPCKMVFCERRNVWTLQLPKD